MTHEPADKSVISINRLVLLICFVFVVLNLPLSLLTQNRLQVDHSYTKVDEAAYIIDLFQSSDRYSPRIIDKIVMALNYEDLHVKVGSKPLYAKRVTAINCSSLQGCQKELRQQLLMATNYKASRIVAFSYYLPVYRLWLNISFYKRTTTLLSIILVLIELIVIIAAFTYLIFVRRFVKPWRKIIKISRQVGLPVETRFPYFVAPPIIKESIRLMETMVKKIEALINERVATIASLSHDIRTPLTRAEFYLYKSKDEELTSNIQRQFEEIQHYLNQTLSYAKQDYQDEPKRKLDLVSLLTTICDEMCDVGQSVNHSTSVDCFVIEGQRISLRRAFSNLIENGIKYGQAVDVYISQQQRSLLIEIIDHGQGLPDAALTTVLQPFQRYTENHENKIAGTGLGLSIAKSIIENNGGELIIANTEQSDLGLKVSVIFNGEIKSNA